LQNVVNHILENDYAVIENVEQSTIKKAKKMFMILAEQVPQKPNMSELYRELDTDRNQGLKMLYALEKAGLLSLLTDTPRKLSDLSRPEKIYLNNTNLMNAFTMQPNIGTMRELFFFNQLSQSHQVTYPPKGDFLVDGKYLFEVGGRKKSFDQIKDIPNSYLAIDETEVGFGNKIPLWMFGLLY
jgi:predicted AAA+ superfamily ATPase